MTVAFDAYSESTVATPTDVSYTHTPSGTPRGVLVFLSGTATTDRVGATVTYGDVQMAEVTGSPNVLAGGEGGSVSAFFLGSSVPTGAQTVFADITGAAGANVHCSTITLTASADIEVVDSDGTVNSTSLENPSVTLSLGGRTSFCALGLWSGIDAPANITPLANWTARDESDWGTELTACYTYDVIGSTDVTAGWTQAADDAVMVAVAVSEVNLIQQSLDATGKGVADMSTMTTIEVAQPIGVGVASLVTRPKVPQSLSGVAVGVASLATIVSAAEIHELTAGLKQKWVRIIQADLITFGSSTTAEIADRLNKDEAAIKTVLWRLADSGHVTESGVRGASTTTYYWDWN